MRAGAGSRENAKTCWVNEREGPGRDGEGVRRGPLTVLCQASEGPLGASGTSHSTENSKRIQCGTP